MTVCITRSSVQHIYLVSPVTEQHSHIYAPSSTRGHCGYTNRLINTGSVDNLQGDQGSSVSFGYWVFSKKLDIAILHRHSNGKHSLWKTFLVPGDEIFRAVIKRKGCQCEERETGSAKICCRGASCS